MAIDIQHFESCVRRAHRFHQPARSPASEHPFDARGIHPQIAAVSQQLFDDGHFAQATFEVFKFLDNHIKQIASSTESGFKLMMQAFSQDSPIICLTPGATLTQKDEQKGYSFLFAGGMLAIRNPRGHEHDLQDDLDTCLDHLSFASMLMRRLEQAGYS